MLNTACSIKHSAHEPYQLPITMTRVMAVLCQEFSCKAKMITWNDCELGLTALRAWAWGLRWGVTPPSEAPPLDALRVATTEPAQD